jgi:hypothetical protein
MLFAVEYQLHALLGVSGATVIFTLTGAVLLGGFTAKYVHLFERYRALAGEFRQIPDPNARKASLLKQIDNYRQRIRLLNVASLCMGAALMLFLFTVIIASLSVIEPELPWLRPLGTFGLVGGLVLACGAVALDLAEVLLSRNVICEEVTDVHGCSQKEGG